MFRPSAKKRSAKRGAAATVDLAALIDPSRIVDLEATDKDGALNELVDVLGAAPEIGDKEELRQAIFERERVLSTGIGIGVAVPHVRLASVSDFVIAIGRSTRGVDFEALDDAPAHIVVMIAVPERHSRHYLTLLAQLVSRLKDKGFQKRVLSARDPQEIKDAFVRAAA